MAQQHNNAENLLANLRAGMGNSADAQQALAALAQTQMAYNPMAASLYNPFAGIYGFGNPMLSAAGMTWPGMSADYLMNMNAWQTLQNQAMVSGAPTNCTMSSPGSESFAELLRKMPQLPGEGGDSSSVHTNGAPQELSPRESESDGALDCRSSSDNKLATLAAVAEQMHKTEVDGEPTAKSSPPRTNSRASDVVLPLKKRPIGLESATSPQSKIPKLEPSEPVVKSEPELSPQQPETSAPNLKTEGNEETSTDQQPAPLSTDVQMNSHLLEASARAWAALSNQFLINMQSEMFRQQPQEKQKRRGSGRRGGRPRKTVSAINGNQGRAALTSTESDGRDTVDDTIESVLRNTELADAAVISQRLLGTLPSSRRGRGRGGRRRGGCAVTVREQLAIRRAHDGDDDTVGTTETPLDLTLKPESGTSPEMDEKQLESRGNSSSEDRSTDTPQYPRKRRVAEARLVRIPLAKGWRRQTCIRSISATGVRGDVIYYAPCGKRLGSYAEVIRYLNKHRINDIGRDNFSFSCKVLVGEFLQIKADSGKNGITRLSESDVLEIMEDLAKGHPRPAKSRGDEFITRDNVRTEIRRGRRGARHSTIGRVANKDKETDGEERSEKVMDVMRKAKEQQDFRKQQINFIQKQSEEYYRQLLLVGLEQEKLRQHLLAAKTYENRRRQEERQRQYAERLIRQEERIAARNAHLNRMKILRQPTEDLEVDSYTRSLPQFSRVPGLELSGQTFADLLMVMEFIQNFGHVLKIDSNDVPSLATMHAALLGDSNHLRSLRKVTTILLTLVLEYPGLPVGPQGRTFLGQTVKEVGVNRDNYSELLRMFLGTRDFQGQQFGQLLEEEHFESLSAQSKTSILAYMCNELLYCRNVVREIEGNIDEVVRLKGDKWAREGKIRLIRGIQANKKMEAHRRSLSAGNNNNNTAGVEINEDLELDQQHRDTPASMASIDSDASETKPIAQIIREEQKKNALKESASQSPKESTPVSDDKCTKKPVPPGSSQLDTVTEEEKQMTPDQLEEVAQSLGAEATELRNAVSDTACRVRAQSYGYDRYHRLYWVLPHTGCVLIEGLESSHKHNPTVESCLPSASHSEESDVQDCVDYLVNLVACDSQSLASLTGESSERRLTVPENLRDGWWCISKEDDVDQLQKSMLSRGIRERNMHRSLTKYEDYIKRKGCVATLSLESETKGEPVTGKQLELKRLRRMKRNIVEFEEKVLHANVHVRKWRPINNAEQSKARETTNQPPPPPAKTTTITEPPAVDDDSSKSSWSSVDSISKEFASIETVPEMLDDLKYRLLHIERNTERRYMKSPFHHGHSILPETVLNSCAQAEKQAAECNPSTSQTPDRGDEPSSDETSAELDRWRSSVKQSSNACQLMLCLQQLDANIAWDRSIMRASCQICRSGDNESELLLCDCCDLGYHTYCFVPKMTTIPVGDWFCPACIEKASDNPCCLICCKQSGTFLTCINCLHAFHEECALVTRKLSKESAKSWICPGCTKRPVACPDSSEGGTSGDTKVSKPRNKLLAKRPLSQSPRDSRASSPLPFTELCGIVLAELDAHKDSWPFKLPVDTKALPLYKKVIRKPMDLSTVHKNLNQNKYEDEQQFVDDVRQIFENCKTFNEDDSPVGKAGHSVRRYFNRRWKELKEGNCIPTTRGRPRKYKE